MKILVVGCGSIGERHINNLLISYPEHRIYATDISSERRLYIESKYGISTFNTIDESFKIGIDIVFVCTPPNTHIPIAQQAIDENAHVFIEKPISNTMHDVKKLIHKASSKNLKIFVGYCFRFNKGLKLVKKIIESGDIGKVLLAYAEYGQFLPKWRPWQNYRQSYTAKKDLGGGIILDSSHEVDYLRWLIGEIDEVSSFADKISDLEMEVEDVACIIIRFNERQLGMIRIDMVRKDYSRKCEIICENGTIKWNFQKNTVKVYDESIKKWSVFEMDADINDMYIDEISHFISCIINNKQPLIDGTEGFNTLKVTLAIKESINNREIRSI